MQSSVTILVVDDSPFAARALVHVLESRGMRAKAASTMEEAMRICTLTVSSVGNPPKCPEQVAVTSTTSPSRYRTRSIQWLPAFASAPPPACSGSVSQARAGSG